MKLNKFQSLFGIAFGGAVSFGSICIYTGDETTYSKALMPIVSKFDPEFAHETCIFLTKHKLIRCRNKLNEERAAKLRTQVFNLKFNNPIGIAAGFDKNSDAVPGLMNYGVGFTEVGTVTPLAQDGNPRKRIFRIEKERALINRCGFNNKGIDYVVNNLSSQKSFGPMIVGLNLGKNKTTSDISSDYLRGLERARDIEAVDYIVINISSPNTPGLRDIQDKKNLERLLSDVLSKMNALCFQRPLLVKIAPDLTDSQIKDVADVLMSKKCNNIGVSGVILTNTTIARPFEHSESGGLSGKPLREASTRIISQFYKLTKGQIPIVGVGGVSSGEDAYEKIKAGASLIQLYTGLTYDGPPIINRIKRELVDILERDGFNNISEVVGLDHKSSNK